MCHPDTRRAVQEMVFSWIAHDDGPKRILWMSGPAGCGKTAIAGSIAEVCEEKGLLVATFFFSSFAGSPSRRWKRFLIPTLVYQLMQSDGTGTLREHIISSVKRDPTVFRKRLKDQCKILLLEPLQRFTASRLPSSPQVIVIDGLDEVESEATTRDSSGSTTRLQAIQANEIDQVEILSALLQLVSNPVFPFRIFISSRPERWIRGFFAAEAAKSVTRELFLDDKYNPDDDIELFLRNKFSDIRHRYNIPSNWPTENAIKTLVHRASGQFIYAATAIRFVQDGTHPPALQLERVLQLKHEATDGSPLAALDALYVNVLSSGPEPWLASEWIMLLGTEHYPSLPARYCRQLFETTTGQAEHLLGNLSSLIHTPAFDDVSSPYRIYHRSLCDFLRVQRGQDVSRRDAMGLREKSYIQIFQSASITVGCCLVPNDSLVFDRSLPDKAPWIPLAPSEARPFFQTLLKDDWASFLESVLTVFGEHNSRGITGSHLELEWWVRTAMASNPDLAPQNIAQMFWRVHADVSTLRLLPQRAMALTPCFYCSVTTSGTCVLLYVSNGGRPS